MRVIGPGLWMLLILIVLAMAITFAAPAKLSIMPPDEEQYVLITIRFDTGAKVIHYIAPPDAGSRCRSIGAYGHAVLSMAELKGGWACYSKEMIEARGRGEE